MVCQRGGKRGKRGCHRVCQRGVRGWVEGVS